MSTDTNMNTSKFTNLTATELIQRFGVEKTASVISTPHHPFCVVVYGHVVARYTNRACAEDTANNEIDRIVADIHKHGGERNFKLTVREQAADVVRIVDHTDGLRKVYKLSPGRIWNLSIKESTLTLK